MIHSHYDSDQILWFVRNYWKYTRDHLIQEFRRTFQDTNFAKSQYQWLKTRYGMKEEWGASLNNPPYAGARPGGPGTEHYEPPDVPTHAPQMIFRTRSDSPTPNLVVAPLPLPALVNMGGQAAGAAPRQRIFSTGSLRSVQDEEKDEDSAMVDGTALTTVTSPATSNSYTVPGQTGQTATNGMNGTYMFNLSTLGSPFAPAVNQVASFSGANFNNNFMGTAGMNNMGNMGNMNNVGNMGMGNMSMGNMAGMNNMNNMANMSSFSMPNNTDNPFLTENNAMANGQQANHLAGQQNMGVNNDHMLLDMFPFAPSQPHQNAGGQFGAAFNGQVSGDNNMMQSQLGLTGLGINNNQQHLGQQTALTNVNNMMMPTNISPNAFGGMGSVSPSQFSSPSQIFAGSPNKLAQKFLETIVAPDGKILPVLNANRKRKLEVECHAPTRLVPGMPCMAGSPSQVIAAATHGGASPAKKQKSNKSSVANKSPVTSAASPPKTKKAKSPKLSKTPASTSAAESSYAAAVSQADAPQAIAEAPVVQTQPVSIDLTQAVDMPAGNDSGSAESSPSMSTLSTLAFRPKPQAQVAPVQMQVQTQMQTQMQTQVQTQVQTPASSRTNSFGAGSTFVLPIQSRTPSSDGVSVSSPPSAVESSPSDKAPSPAPAMAEAPVQAPVEQAPATPDLTPLLEATIVMDDSFTPDQTTDDVPAGGEDISMYLNNTDDLFGDAMLFGEDGSSLEPAAANNQMPTTVNTSDLTLPVSSAADNGFLTLPVVDNGDLTFPTVDNGGLLFPTVDNGNLTSPTVNNGDIALPAMNSGDLMLPTMDSGDPMLPTMNNADDTFPTAGEDDLGGPGPLQEFSFISSSQSSFELFGGN